MAKFPTEVERSVTVKAPLAKVYKYLADVVGSSDCIPGIDTCKEVKKGTYSFTYAERSTGPVSMVVRYTAKYTNNGKDTISFEGVDADGDNTEVRGTLKLQAASPTTTKIVLQQMLAPDTPVPRLLQGFLKSFVEQEASEAARQYLANVKKTLEA